MKHIVVPRPLRGRSGVTVVIPCYNYGRYLPAAVDSVLSQPGVDAHVLIIDDASPDGSADVARELAQTRPRVRAILHSENQKHIRTYNDGLKRVETEFVTLVSADDVLAPGSLSRSVALMQRYPQVGLVYGPIATFAEDTEELPTRNRRYHLWRIWDGDEWTRGVTQSGYNPIASPEALVRTAAMREIGLYNPELPHTGDLEYWLRIAARWDVGQIHGRVQAYYRVHGENMHLADFGSRVADLRERLAAFKVLADWTRSQPTATQRLEEARQTLLVQAEALAAEARAVGADESAALTELRTALATPIGEGHPHPTPEWPVRERAVLADPVPMLDLAHQHSAVAGVVEAGFARVLSEQTFVLGPEVEAFERAYAGYVGVDHAIGVGNGTDALELALRAVGAGPGDEIVIPANTFVATAEAVARVGATIRLVDCGDDYLLDTGMLPSALGPRTKAVVPVHLYGCLADIAAIRRIAGPDVAIIEDAAQSQGARRDGRVSGSLGDVAATSFYPGKNLGAYGDAGAVTTASSAIARAVRALRNHGGEARYEHFVVGSNSRLDGLQAVVLAAKLAHLDEWNAERRDIAERYRAAFEDDGRVVLPPAVHPDAHVYHQFVVQVDDRDRVHAQMTADGIGVGIHYPRPVHLLPAFQGRDLGGPGSFPRAERQARRILSLPIYPGLTVAMQARVVASLRAALQ